MSTNMRNNDGCQQLSVKEEYSSICDSVSEGFNESLAVLKWRPKTQVADMFSLRDTIPASLQRPSKSAPVKRCVLSKLHWRVWI